VRGLRYFPLDVVNYSESVVDEFGHRGRVEVGRHQTWGNVQGGGASTEQLGSNITVTNYSIFLGPGETVDAGDEIEVDGARYLIDGQPVFARNARGVHHIEVNGRYVGPVDVPTTPAGA
jgi:hypothetical protein